MIVEIILSLVILSLVGWMINVFTYILASTEKERIADVDSKRKMIFWITPWLPAVYFLVISIRDEVTKFKNLR